MMNVGARLAFIALPTPFSGNYFIRLVGPTIIRSLSQLPPLDFAHSAILRLLIRRCGYSRRTMSDRAMENPADAGR